MILTVKWRSTNRNSAVSAIALVMALIASLPAAAQAPGTGWATDFAAARARALSEGKPIAVVVTAGIWCDPCVWLDENTLSNRDVQRELSQAWVPVRINDTNPVWQQWDVRRLPTILLLSADGEVAATLDGAVTARTLLDRLTSISQSGETPDRPAAATDDRDLSGAVFRIGSGTVWNDGRGTWYTQDVGLPPQLTEYDRDEAFLYLRDEASATLLAITVMAGSDRSLWRWDQQQRTWDPVADLIRLD